MARPRPQKRERDDPRSGQLPLPDLRFGLKPPRKRVLLVPIPHVVIRRRQLSSRPVLHPAAGGEPLDADSFSADCRAHRATRMAPHVIEKAGHGGREKAERSWREYLWAGGSPRANLRKMGRQPPGRRGNGPCDAFRTAERASGTSRRPFRHARERELGSKSQIPAETRRDQWTERRFLRH